MLARISTVDGRLDPADAEAFAATGVLVVSGLVGGDELAALQHETAALIAALACVGDADPDHRFRPGPDGGYVPYRVEHLLDKSPAARALAAHPVMLNVVASLQGPDFFCTNDSLVFKGAGAGAAVSWHRDSATSGYLPVPFFNVAVALDDATVDDCVWVIPGSSAWRERDAQAVVSEADASGLIPDGAVPVTLAAGDALVLDVRVVHHSPASTGALRRIAYFEFRPAWFERAFGPHTARYVDIRRAVLRACEEERSATMYGAATPAFGCASPDEPVVLTSFRHPHGEHARPPHTDGAT